MQTHPRGQTGLSLQLRTSKGEMPNKRLRNTSLLGVYLLCEEELRYPRLRFVSQPNSSLSRDS